MSVRWSSTVFLAGISSSLIVFPLILPGLAQAPLFPNAPPSTSPRPLFPQLPRGEQPPAPLFPTPSTSPTTTPSPITAETLPELERRIFEQVNQYRLQRGLRPLQMDPRISAHARAHSQAMAGRQVPFGHTDFSQRIRRVNQIISSRRVSENVAYIFSHNDPAKRAFDGWLRSPAHRRAIEDNFSVTGVGVALGDRGALYFTQIYVRPR